MPDLKGVVTKKLGKKLDKKAKTYMSGLSTVINEEDVRELCPTPKPSEGNGTNTGKEKCSSFSKSLNSFLNVPINLINSQIKKIFSELHDKNTLMKKASTSVIEGLATSVNIYSTINEYLDEAIQDSSKIEINCLKIVASGTKQKAVIATLLGIVNPLALLSYDIKVIEVLLEKEEEAIERVIFTCSRLLGSSVTSKSVTKRLLPKLFPEKPQVSSNEQKCLIIVRNFTDYRTNALNSMLTTIIKETSRINKLMDKVSTKGDKIVSSEQDFLLKNKASTCSGKEVIKNEIKKLSKNLNVKLKDKVKSMRKKDDDLE